MTFTGKYGGLATNGRSGEGREGGCLQFDVALFGPVDGLPYDVIVGQQWRGGLVSCTPQAGTSAGASLAKQRSTMSAPTSHPLRLQNYDTGIERHAGYGTGSENMTWTTALISRNSNATHQCD